MMKRNFTLLNVLIILLICSVGAILAQDLQQQYNDKLRQAKEINMKMNQQGITKDDYNKLLKQYEALTTELSSIKEKLNADVELTEKLNNAKRAYNNGNTLYKKGQFDEALAAYDKAINLDSNYSKAFYGKGLTFVKQRKYEEAIEAYKQAIEIDPSYARAYSAMGSVYKDMKKYNESVEAYQKAIEIDTKSYATIYNLALVFNSMKDYPNAIKYFRMATQVKPDYYKAFTLLGETFMNSGDADQAVMALENALAIKPDYDRANFQLAMIYNKMQKYAEALKAAEDCLKKPGRYKGGANFEAGIACKQLGDTAKAKTYFEAASRDSRWRKNAQYEIDLINKGK